LLIYEKSVKNFDEEDCFKRVIDAYSYFGIKFLSSYDNN